MHSYHTLFFFKNVILGGKVLLYKEAYEPRSIFHYFVVYSGRPFLLTLFYRIDEFDFVSTITCIIQKRWQQ